MLGETHPYVGITNYHIAKVLVKQVKYTEAERLSREAVNLLRDGMGESHPRHAIALRQLGIIQSELKKFSEAESSLQKAIAIFEKRQPVDSVALGSTLEGYEELLRKVSSHSGSPLFS